jgi:UV DNA damage endonuclease
MKIGYPCLNRTIGCTPNRTFRLASYSEDRLYETVHSNIACLRRVLENNVREHLLFFRIGSQFVPFASHPICTADWRSTFARQLRSLGTYAKRRGIRIGMHPDQFVVINSPNVSVAARSVAELEYHAALLDSMGLPVNAKIQIHAGGVYGDKDAAIARFVRRYSSLPRAVRRRLALENDDTSYALADCLRLHERTGIPVILDTFHHEFLNHGECLKDAVECAAATWRRNDGRPMIDYSSRQPGARRALHAATLSSAHFRQALQSLRPTPCDIMLEIKDKEASATKARDILRHEGLLDG